MSLREIIFLGCLISFCDLIAQPLSNSPLEAETAEPASPVTGRLGNLLTLDLLTLTNMEVTSVSKRKERLFDAPSAISVLTNEDIRRSGMRSYPELLRLVPGMQVSQYSSNSWSVASRGFGGRFSDKLLVLMDGRTIYSPFFSGVIWDMQDYLLEDIDRIEVIRGPGATLWGANAVNGVINIQSKDSADTQGMYLEGGYGTNTGFEGLRYGGRASEELTYRVYQKYTHDNAFTPTTGNNFDDRDFQQTGFRMDWKPSLSDNFTLQGDLYSGQKGTRNRVGATPGFPGSFLTPSVSILGINASQIDVNDTTKSTGTNVLGRWQHFIEDDNEVTVQAYYDRTYRNELFYTETRQTIDLDVKHRVVPMEGHQIVWGLGSRGTFDDIENGDSPGGIPLITYNTARRNNLTLSGFIQDTIALIPETLFFTAGTKLERNDYSGLEVQPGAKLSYHPKETHTLWASVARSVKTPNRGQNDTNFLVNNTDFGSFIILPNTELESEEVLSYELGHRWQVTPEIRLQTATFYNVYDNSVGVAEVSPRPPDTFSTLQLSNDVSGTSYGAEWEVTYQPFEIWRLSGSYSWWRAQLSGTAPTPAGVELAAPQHQAKIHSSLDLPQNISFDQSLFWVDQTSPLDPTLVESFDVTSDVPSYFRLDLRVAWQATPHCEFSLTGQNLLDPLHLEQGPSGFQELPTQIPRSVYGMVSIKF
jgi:iron complex outermembrane recepter protein